MPVATTEFEAHETDIPDLLIFDVNFPSDERGYFQEKYQKEKLVAAGLPKSFNIVQNNVSFNKSPGVVRGFHAEPWDKYISVITGKVFVAYVDLRKGPSFGKTFSGVIDNNKSVYLPRGVANSFQTLEENTLYVYSTNDHWRSYNYDSYVFVNLADKQIGANWPIPLADSIMSQRDKNHPMLKDIKPMEF
ncbi:MAG TPA: dTDP-4-dehydrorhamnose 3,5-epimerase family protein [Candidatus Saccharimonadales bacterium]|nr:dTDP-4-dehydrorhamnose 3,5-epimerase family protein [Candidatus Saccharimonadales bacterium]